MISRSRTGGGVLLIWCCWSSLWWCSVVVTAYHVVGLNDGLNDYCRSSSSSSSCHLITFYKTTRLRRFAAVDLVDEDDPRSKCPNNNNPKERISSSKTTGIGQERKETAAKKKTRRNRSWDESYALLVEFYKENGHANLPYNYKKDPKLSEWMGAQRRRKSSLSPDKIAKLDALNITWDGAKEQRDKDKWEEMFQCLLEYKNWTGHCRVPDKCKDNPKLGSWVKNQRHLYTVNKLSPERVKRLESIGFIWRLREFVELGPDVLLWEERFQELLKYKEEHGNCRVPTVFDENPALGNWVNTQRRFNVDGLILPQRKKRLDEIDFTWDFDEIRDEAWLDMFNQLKELRNADVFDANANANERKTWSKYQEQHDLYTWEQAQQDMYNRGTLDNEREMLLEGIGYWYSLGMKKA